MSFKDVEIDADTDCSLVWADCSTKEAGSQIFLIPEDDSNEDILGSIMMAQKRQITNNATTGRIIGLLSLDKVIDTIVIQTVHTVQIDCRLQSVVNVTLRSLMDLIHQGYIKLRFVGDYT